MSVQTTDTVVSVPHTPNTIVERTTVWKGGVVEMKIPTESYCRQGSFEDFWYVQFGRVISPKNIINVFVHADRPMEYCGKKIRAEIEICLKRFADGRCYHHIDLRPTTEPASHKLKILPDVGMEQKDGLIILPLEQPQTGEVLLISFAKSTKVEALPTEQQVPKTSSTGDGQLDRLLAAGWNIESGGNGREVELFKYKDGKKRTMTHHKPKK